MTLSELRKRWGLPSVERAEETAAVVCRALRAAAIAEGLADRLGPKGDYYLVALDHGDNRARRLGRALARAAEGLLSRPFDAGQGSAMVWVYRNDIRLGGERLAARWGFGETLTSAFVEGLVRTAVASA